MRQTILFIVAVGSMLCADVFADQVILKNGDRLTGTITKLEGEKLSMKSELAGEVTIPWAAITEISSNQPLYLTLKDEQVVVGTVATSAGRIEIQTKEAGKVTVSKDVIQAVRSPAEQASYQAKIDRLRNPRLSDFWSGFVDTGLSLTRGNAKTTTFSLGANAARATPRDKISVYLASLLAKNGTTGRTVTTANAIRGGLRYDFNLSDRLFAFAFTDLEFDEFQKLDLRLVLGGGLGYHAKKTERTVLDLFAGGSFNKEYFSTGVRRKSGEVLFGEDLSYKLSNRTSLKERLVFFPNLSESGEYRVTFDTSAVTNLNRWLGWQVTISDRYLSNPVPGAKKNDLLLTTGLRLTFAGRGL